MVYNPFNFPLQQAWNVAKIVGAGKLAEAAFQVFPSKKTTDNMPPYAHGLTKTMTKRKRRPGKKNSKLATVATVKRMILGREEKKFKASGATLASISDSIIYTYNFTAQVTSGTEDGERIGDSINLSSFDAFLRWYTDTEAAYYQLRVLVFWSGEEYNPSSTLFSSSGFGGTQLFKPYTALPAQALINPKAITVVHDGYIEINSAINGYEDGAAHKIHVNFNGQKYDYRQDLSVYGKKKNLYMCIIGGFKSSNADPPENIGAAYINWSLNYTDS